VSCKSKLPVLDWTAAEAANLFFLFGHIRFFGTFGLKQTQVSGARGVLLPEVAMATKCQ
jgi:hypothetical protein